MLDAYIYDGVRTPFGRHAGGLAAVRSDDLLTHVIKTLAARNVFNHQLIEDVVVGVTNQAGEDCRNVARMAGLMAGLPIETGGVTLNRLCGSSMAALLDAARAVTVGDGAFYIVGGVESMSRAPFVMAKAEGAYSRNMEIYDSTIGARFPNPALISAFGNDAMPETADNVAKDLNISREDSDIFAAASQAKYAAAKTRGYFKDEIVPVEVSQGRKKPPLIISEDEHPRPESTVDKLAALKALYEGGVVTAGNASGINDGAVALLIGSKQAGEKAGLKPRARILAGAIAGVPPRVMGLGPVPASAKALARAGLSLAQMDVLELNEAFATQVLGCLKSMQLPFNDQRVNPNGGAIAIGHPLGASGARIALTALRQLEASKGRYALATMCIGVGQGIATVIERLD
ncbi:MAG: 3-oxoadipyl-CoA thiolase [Gammaproteobacteria bacterium]|nr:3-oxoadipyl-CoA thiolase [Gammaproteobacteria bacterium]